MRQPYINFARLNQIKIRLLHFDIPMDICLERNAKRQQPVPNDVITKIENFFKIINLEILKLLLV